LPVAIKNLPVFLFAAALAAASEPAKPIEPRVPKLNSVFPQGAQPGAKVRVEVLGEFVDRAQTVVFLDPTVHGDVVESTYTRLTLDFTTAPDVPLGPHYFRIVTPRGASNVLLFRVGDQPHILEQEPNSTFEQAQEVTIPATINGRLNTDGDFDFYRFHAGKGQSWIFDLRAARNGNGLDAALILADAKGRRLRHSEDVFIWDPFIQYTFEETGVYYAIVQPTHRHNDPNFAYQLDIRTAPHLETISPISMPPGATVEATVFGAGLTGSGKLWFEGPGFSGEVLEMRGHLLVEESAVLRGPTVGWGHAFDAEYPTETVVDELMKGVVDCEDRIAPIVGKRGPDWAVFSATPTIHVAGQGEAWHRDADNRAGSWVYYAHPEWNVEWGGELLLSQEKDIPPEYGVYLHRLRPMADLPDPPAWRSHLDNQDASQLLMSHGIGSYVFPKPNRLVVVKGGTPYAIAKTRASAGRHVRASFGGFFLRAGVALAQP